MATYSAFFSSGLLAPGITRPSTPTNSAPLASSPVDPVDLEFLHVPITPKPSHAKSVTANAAGERPRMRRRRSSINIAVSPMAAIKSPSRNATSAFQRAGIISPTRSRAGSVNEASENNSLIGRLRSGSVTVMQPFRSRRVVRRTVPTAPPPMVPLPAVPPPSPTTKCSGGLLPPTIHLPSPRQPLSIRGAGSWSDNTGNLCSPPLLSPTLLSPTLLSPDYPPKSPARMMPSRASSPAIPDEVKYFDDPIDVDMKEN
ncbi:hypothetical protein PISMIDRAFT_11806 [Pisolithus microcarpus 441]|uniref:Uncharacterized protein n=1 Tax=Pisolithus microcarpus 441 TaxID=765257 RepID=A0A0C9YBV7_9AGAM|nr:hypothetical protein PISMIDRAFT_11806 [Pisolithus microcarpus 441]